jgi:hypothetical protein
MKLLILLSSLLIVSGCATKKPVIDPGLVRAPALQLDLVLLAPCEPFLEKLETSGDGLKVEEILKALDRSAANYSECASSKKKLAEWVCTHVLKDACLK